MIYETIDLALYPITIAFTIHLLAALRNIAFGISSKKWLKVRATILESDVEIGSEQYHPTVSYSYAAPNKKIITSKKLSYKILVTFSFNNAFQALPANGPTVAYINPKNYKQSVLLPGTNIANYIEVAASTLAIVFIVKRLILLNAG